MIENAVDRDHRQLKINATESQRLHCILRDLSTLTQALARLSSFFTDQGMFKIFLRNNIKNTFHHIQIKPTTENK